MTRNHLAQGCSIDKKNNPVFTEISELGLLIHCLQRARQ